MKKLKFMLGIVVSLAVAAALVYAGAGYSLICRDEKCKYRGSVNFGGARRFTETTGYCVGCDKFVYLKAPRGGKQPTPVGKVWNSKTGETLELYACPHCAKPFLRIASEKDLKHCPKCGQATLAKTLAFHKD